MGSKKNIPLRSRIIDSFLAKFKKVVNSAGLSDKVADSPMASLVTPNTVMVPPTALRSALTTTYMNGQNRYSADSRRSSDSTVNSARSETDKSVISVEKKINNIDKSVVIEKMVHDIDKRVQSIDIKVHNIDNSVNSVSTNGYDASNQSAADKREATDFIFGKIIGEGSFSTVYLAKDIHTRREYAIKVCMKSHIIREKKVEQIRREREILTLLSSKERETSPFFVKIYSSFQDTQRLYFVLTYAKHGELFSHINKVGSFDAACTQFYAGEILHALEHMHSLGVVHRDLKPENILLDHDMHIQITDFGSAKIMSRNDDENEEETAARRNSFVGTAQYISPELLSDRGDCSRASDLWAFGAIVYQMVAGLPPFRSSSEYLIFRKIKNLEYEFPDGFSPTAKDLVQRLLVLDPKQRLGANDGQLYTSIRAHPFFTGVVLEKLYKQTPPAIYPYLPGSSAQEELRSHYRVPDHLEPGLDDRQITRLLGLELQGCSPPKSQSPEPVERRQRSLLGLASLTPAEIERRLTEQRKSDPRWHGLCDGNLILKRGLVHKRKGLFARRRMLMLTTGPHLYYADPETMTLKGEIPWSPELRVEPKNFKIFFVHTPNRTYYLQDPEGYALDWCKAIEEMRVHTYDKKT